jgi:hypothetical protein
MEIPKGKALIEKSAKGPSRFQLFIPITKMSEYAGSLIVEGCASVSDYVDEQGDSFTPEALKKAAEGWAPIGNIRFQHNSNRPIGTVREPIFGKMEGVEPPGWWIGKHPVTGTDALFLRAHIIEAEAIKAYKSGMLTGFSVGGSIPENGYHYEEVEVDDNGTVHRDA